MTLAAVRDDQRADAFLEELKLLRRRVIGARRCRSRQQPGQQQERPYALHHFRPRSSRKARSTSEPTINACTAGDLIIEPPAARNNIGGATGEDRARHVHRGWRAPAGDATRVVEVVSAAGAGASLFTLTMFSRRSRTRA